MNLKNRIELKWKRSVFNLCLYSIKINLNFIILLLLSNSLEKKTMISIFLRNIVLCYVTFLRIKIKVVSWNIVNDDNIRNKYYIITRLKRCRKFFHKLTRILIDPFYRFAEATFLCPATVRAEALTMASKDLILSIRIRSLLLRNFVLNWILVSRKLTRWLKMNFNYSKKKKVT